MNTDAESFLKRLRVAVGHTHAFTGIGDWLCGHTRLNDAPFSFEDHEFQRQLADEQARRLTVRKCSQVGLSELMVRKLLAFLATNSNTTAILTLPTTLFARQFSKGRIDPVIQTSDVLSSQLGRGTDSSEMKQIGSSFLYIRGTFGQQQAISIPATVVCQDETDFSNPTVLTTYASRLRHAEGGGYLWRFSTPTVNGYGVSAGFEEGTQHHYLVRCRNCGEEQAVDFFAQCRIPGFNASVREFDKDDLRNHRREVEGATLNCARCEAPLDFAPEYRRWAATHPEREARSYQVAPWDLPRYNSVPGILQQLESYERYADWANFVLGVPFEDAHSSFLAEVIRRNTCLPPVSPQVGGYGFCMGVDVGKTSWVVIGKPVERRLHVVWAQQLSILEAGEGGLIGQLKQLMRAYSVQRVCIDAGPDFSTALGLVQAFSPGTVFAVYYTRRAKRDLSLFEVDVDNGVISANRTKTLDMLAKDVNAGGVLFPLMEESTLIRDHLGSLKRVEQTDEEGETQAKWIKVESQADHYAQALNYLRLAAQTLQQGMGFGAIPAPVSMNTLVPGSALIGAASPGGQPAQSRWERLRPNTRLLLGERRN